MTEQSLDTLIADGNGKATFSSDGATIVKYAELPKPW